MVGNDTTFNPYRYTINWLGSGNPLFLEFPKTSSFVRVVYA